MSPVQMRLREVGVTLMNNLWDRLKAELLGLLRQSRVQKWLISALAVLLILQLYFVREMLAAEVLFGIGFAMLLVICGVFYLVGAIGEWVLDLAEAGIRVAVRSTRWSVATVEEISKKQFRRPHSESAP